MIAQLQKAHQDMMDAALCLLTALRWRLRPRGESLLLGDLTAGYMVLPANPAVREYLTAPARRYSVAMDGVVPPEVAPSVRSARTLFALAVAQHRPRQSSISRTSGMTLLA
jgi:hypothetical protein